MANLEFMQVKFSRDKLLTNYMADISALQPQATTPNDKTKLQLYYQAANKVKKAKVMEVAQIALSFGRHLTGNAEEVWGAIRVLVGDRVTHPTQIDLVYSRLLLEYARGFNSNKSRLSDWILRFIINSPISPVKNLIQKHINYVINETERRITMYEASL